MVPRTKRASAGVRQRQGHDVLGHEPRLPLVAADDFAHEEIAGPIVAALSRQACQRSVMVSASNWLRLPTLI
jgi:hypothetical protein